MPDQRPVAAVRPLRALIAEATARLAAAGVPSPRHDAEALAAHAFQVRRADLVGLDCVDPAAVDGFCRSVDLRARRIPLQHIVGTAAFRHVDVAVGPGVFVPRPETELVAGWAIERARDIVDAGNVPLVVDLCTGSGAIALAVVDEVPTAVVHAVELDPDALPYTRRNLVDTGVRLHEGDAAAALPELDGTVDVVVSNPPYIPPDGVIRDPEVARHDPPLALWGHGPDGLDVLRSVALTARRLLREGGCFVVEHADVQGAAVPSVLSGQGGWDQVVDHRDLAGRDRFTTARRHANVPAGTVPLPEE